MSRQPRKVSPSEANHVVAKIVGVTTDDNVFEAAEKTIAVLRAAGMDRAARQAERMLAAARERHNGR